LGKLKGIWKTPLIIKFNSNDIYSKHYKPIHNWLLFILTVLKYSKTMFLSINQGNISEVLQQYEDYGITQTFEIYVTFTFINVVCPLDASCKHYARITQCYFKFRGATFLWNKRVYEGSSNSVHT